MSQPPSFIDPFSPPTVTEREMVKFVEDYCAADAPPHPWEWLVDSLRDPFSKDDHYRMNPLWVSLAVFFVMASATFIYFSFWSR